MTPTGIYFSEVLPGAPGEYVTILQPEVSYVPYSSICLSFFHSCSHQILEFFVRGEKYEKLSLTRTGRNGQHVFISKYFGVPAMELKHRDVLILNSFCCLIQVAVRTESDATDVLNYASWVETNIRK